MMQAIDLEKTQRCVFFRALDKQCALNVHQGRHETVEDALMPEVQNLRRVKPAVLATKDRAF